MIFCLLRTAHKTLEEPSGGFQNALHELRPVTVISLPSMVDLNGKAFEDILRILGESSQK